MSTDKALKTTPFYLIIIVTILLGSVVVSAQEGYPQPADKYVNDYAEVLGPDDKKNIRTMLSGLERQTGIEATVLTINSIHDYDTGNTTLESFATDLFNTWGIGDKEKNDGLLVLVAVGDRKVRIELGSGYGSKFNQAMQRVIDEKMLPHFREADYGQGIYAGAQAAIDVVTGDSHQLSDSTSLRSRDVWLALLVGVTGSGVIVWTAHKISNKLYPKRSSSSKRRRSGRRGTDNIWVDGGSSFGGSDSFGGGSSAGDGASGDW